MTLMSVDENIIFHKFILISEAYMPRIKNLLQELANSLRSDYTSGRLSLRAPALTPDFGGKSSMF